MRNQILKKPSLPLGQIPILCQQGDTILWVCGLWVLGKVVGYSGLTGEFCGLREPDWRILWINKFLHTPQVSRNPQPHKINSLVSAYCSCGRHEAKCVGGWVVVVVVVGGALQLLGTTLDSKSTEGEIFVVGTLSTTTLTAGEGGLRGIPRFDFMAPANYVQQTTYGPTHNNY
jgi:hypothetical protein